MRRSRAPRRAALVAALLALPLAFACAPGDLDASPHRVYVILGFHSNFYHSWRGDTPDEAGFGTDIRLVRALLRMLDEANAEGLDARAYWDSDGHFTLEQIIPEHAPDILAGMRRRVDAGLDEIVLAPYDNGILSAMTEDELRAAVRWSISNPWGSGARDLFGTFTPLLRPNEGMLTTGTLPILASEGITGVVLAYSSYPFNTFSTFVDPLPPEQRYNPTWLRLRPGGPRLVVFPCVSVGDVLNHVSIERWLLDLRELQVRGGVERDLVIHINFDADAESWLPVEMPPGLGWFPNSGGLPEIIAAVNRYDWAAFTTPGRYLADHEPVSEVLVRQDLADGPSDGNYAWAEKFASHAIWTELEASRLATRRAQAWLPLAPDVAQREAWRLLFEGRDSSFFQRLRGLSTTHFGMSTPTVNEERQAVAERIVAAARGQAERAERLLAEEIAAHGMPGTEPGSLASFAVRDVRRAGEGAAITLLRLPVRLPAGVGATRLEDDAGRSLRHSLVNPKQRGAVLSAELLVVLHLEPGETRQLRLRDGLAETRQLRLRDGLAETRQLRLRDEPGAAASAAPATPLRELVNGRIALRLDPEHGVASFRLDGTEIGGPDFLAPFVTYRSHGEPETWWASGYGFEPLTGERWDGVTRARLRSEIPVTPPEGEVRATLRIDFTLPDAAPWIVADVEVVYPYTEKRDLVSTAQKKLRRYLDTRWIEVAPFPLHPRLEADREHPIEVWKNNYLGVTSSFVLDYGRINPANAELDTFNHQITAAFLAVGDGRRGLLLGQSADVRSSHAFAPMRLREERGRQELFINPFGSYYGRFMDYTHVAPLQIGTEFMLIGGSQFSSNAPSYNAQRERFSLLLGPYAGDRPPEELTAAATAFFQPPAVVYATQEPGVRLAQDVRRLDARDERAAALADPSPLPALRAFLVSPTEGAADVVWDESDDPRVEGYEVAWRPADAEAWTTLAVPRASRRRIDDLDDGRAYGFRVRARGGAGAGPWTETAVVTVGPVPPEGIAGIAGSAPLSLLLRTFYYGIVHVLTTP